MGVVDVKSKETQPHGIQATPADIAGVTNEQPADTRKQKLDGHILYFSSVRPTWGGRSRPRFLDGPSRLRPKTAVSTSRWPGLLQAEDDALGDLSHLALTVLDRQFGAGGEAAHVVVVETNRVPRAIGRWGVSVAVKKPVTYSTVVHGCDNSMGGARHETNTTTTRSFHDTY